MSAISGALPGDGVAVLIGERSRRTALLQGEANRVPAAFLHGEHASVVVEVGGDEPRGIALTRIPSDSREIARPTVIAFIAAFEAE